MVLTGDILFYFHRKKTSVPPKTQDAKYFGFLVGMLQLWWLSQVSWFACVVVAMARKSTSVMPVTGNNVLEYLSAMRPGGAIDQKFGLTLELYFGTVIHNNSHVTVHSQQRCPEPEKKAFD